MLIAIEGIDGAGKRTQTERLKARLEANGFTVGVISFPRYGETIMARAVADYLNGKFGDIGDMPAHFPALLYAGDRFESRTLLCELLNARDIVLADRYVASNLAYQGAKLGDAERAEFIDWMTRIEHDVYQLPLADLTVYLDVPVQVSSSLVAKKPKRSYTDATKDLHERNADYMAACRDVYSMLIGAQHRSQWVAVACTDHHGVMRDINTIHAAIWETVEAYLP